MAKMNCGGLGQHLIGGLSCISLGWDSFWRNYLGALEYHGLCWSEFWDAMVCEGAGEVRWSRVVVDVCGGIVGWVGVCRVELN